MYARVSGVFYRLWSYQSELMEEKSAAARQVAPLIVASDLTLITPPIRTSSSSPIGWFGYALCLATLAVLGGILFSVFRKDTTRHHRKTHS